MTEIKRFDLSGYRPDEACRLAAAAWFREHKRYATHLRVDYGTMTNVLLAHRPRRDEFIIEESRAYMIMFIPTGHLLVYMDPELKPGEGVLMSDSPKDEIEVLFAF